MPEAEVLTLAQKLLKVERGVLAETLALELSAGTVVADIVYEQPVASRPVSA